MAAGELSAPVNLHAIAVARLHAPLKRTVPEELAGFADAGIEPSFVANPEALRSSLVKYRKMRVAMAVMSWVLAIPLLGMMTGLRTMTPMAVLCWFAYFGSDGGHLPLGGTWAFWAGRLITAIVFTVLAVGEYIGDKLPATPNRTAPGPLLARLFFGGLVGALAATGAKGSALEGSLLGVLGALAGTFLGYQVRKHLVERSGRPDWNIAVLEDAFALLISVYAMGIVTG